MQSTLRLRVAPATFASLAAILALAVVGVIVLGGGKAAAVQQPSCGDTITTDITLHRDLVNCPNNGIIIGADNVTLDLNYHTIDGDGTPTAGCGQNEWCDIGVVNLGQSAVIGTGHDGVTVMHGSVHGFVAGVNIASASHNRVLGISASRNRFFGVGLVDLARSLVRNSSGSGSFAHEAEGMVLAFSHHVRILHSSFRHNAHLGLLTVDSNNNLIEGNRFSGNDDEAILMEGGERNRMTRNRFVRNGAGITLGPGSRNVITHNRVSRGRDGIRIEKGHNNLVADNVVTHARRAGIRLGIPHPFLGGAHNTVRGNLVKGSRVDGFVVNAKDDHSLLRRNTARHNGDDGLDIESRSTKLTRNKARRNGDLGIHAVRGVIDGGGNRASGNGDPRQCTHVVCR
jgi:parallel beta-helix repeat protein